MRPIIHHARLTQSLTQLTNLFSSLDSPTFLSWRNPPTTRWLSRFDLLFSCVSLDELMNKQSICRCFARPWNSRDLTVMYSRFVVLWNTNDNYPQFVPSKSDLIREFRIAIFHSKTRNTVSRYEETHLVPRFLDNHILCAAAPSILTI